MDNKLTSNEPLKGNIAAILNERELVINIGANKGVKIGMKFKVMSEEPLKILDPNNNEILGEIDREKVRVEVIEVQEKLAIARTYKTRHISGGSLYPWTALATYFSREPFAEPKDVPETLKVKDSNLPQTLSEKESYIKKGDRVIQLLEEDK